MIKRIKRILDAEGINYIDTDGIRLHLVFGWCVIMRSNTENCIIIRFGSSESHYLYFILLYLSNILMRVGLMPIVVNQLTYVQSITYADLE